MSSARRPAPQATAAPMMRSGLSPSKAAFKPPVSAPIRRSAGTSTSSKKSVHCLSGARSAVGMCCFSSPGASESTMNSSGSPRLPSSSRARVTTRIASESSTAEMNVFSPRIS